MKYTIHTKVKYVSSYIIKRNVQVMLLKGYKPQNDGEKWWRHELEDEKKEEREVRRKRSKKMKILNTKGEKANFDMT